LLSGQSIKSDSSLTAASYVQANTLLANVSVGVGTASANYPLDVYGNIHLGNTATDSGILFPDGSFQTTAALNTPSFGPQGTIQYAGTGNTFSGDASNFTWDSTQQILHASNLFAVGNVTANILSGNVLAVNQTASIGSDVSVGGNLKVAGTVIFSNLVAQSITSNTTVQSAGNAIVAGLYSNSFVQVANVVIANSIISNSTVTTPALTVNNTATIGYANVITSAQIGNNLIVGGNLTVTGTFQFGNVGVAQDITVNSVTSNTFVQAAGVGRFARIISNSNVAIGTVTVTGSNALSVFGSANHMGNIYFSNTATISGIAFSDGSFQATAASNTPSFGPPGTVQFAGNGNTFSGNAAAFFWDGNNSRLGIGTNAPSQPLTVTGNLLLTYGNVHQIYGRVGIGEQ